MASPNKDQFNNSEKWLAIVRHFIDVLKINIFIVTSELQLLLTNIQKRYGHELLENEHFGFNINNTQNIFLEKFQKVGHYSEYEHPFSLRTFSIPIKLDDGDLVGYLIVGPISLNKKVDTSEIKKFCQKLNLNQEKILNATHEIRVVSFLTIKSILDLLSEVIRYVVQISFEDRKFSQGFLPKNVKEVAQDIYSSICLDELLVTLLDVALSLTKAECGSIMTLDRDQKTLTVKVSRGLDSDLAKNAQVKIGEGIAGISVKENIPFVISGTNGDSRIKHLLKRPEIKQSLVMPLFTENNIFGVLNLHTKILSNAITEESLHVVQNLSRLTSAALNSIQQFDQVKDETKL